jgi:hypothetical protein
VLPSAHSGNEPTSSDQPDWSDSKNISRPVAAVLDPGVGDTFDDDDDDNDGDDDDDDDDGDGGGGDTSLSEATYASLIAI